MTRVRDLSEKRLRAIRHALSVLFILPAVAMLVLNPPPAAGVRFGWPLEWKAAFVVCTALSLAVGWKPAKEAWTGDDHDIYVDEPEVDESEVDVDD